MSAPLRRPDDLVVQGTLVLLGARTAAWLEEHGLNQLRKNARGIDPRIDRDLMAVHLAALAWRNALDGISGRQFDGSSADPMLTVQEAAKLLNMRPRSVRAAIEQKRLPAQRRGRQWVISADDLKHFRATRRAP